MEFHAFNFTVCMPEFLHRSMRFLVGQMKNASKTAGEKRFFGCFIALTDQYSVILSNKKIKIVIG